MSKELVGREIMAVTGHRGWICEVGEDGSLLASFYPLPESSVESLKAGCVDSMELFDSISAVCDAEKSLSVVDSDFSLLDEKTLPFDGFFVTNIISDSDELICSLRLKYEQLNEIIVLSGFDPEIVDDETYSEIVEKFLLEAIREKTASLNASEEKSSENL